MIVRLLQNTSFFCIALLSLSLLYIEYNYIHLDETYTSELQTIEIIVFFS